MKKHKLAVLTSHPIQYQAPLFRLLSSSSWIELVVYFRENIGFNAYFDKEFGKELKWDIPLLEGYRHSFLKNSFDIARKLFEEKPDAVLVYGWNSFSDWFAIFAAKFFKIKTLLLGENPLNQELFKTKWKIFAKKIILGQILFKIIDIFLYIGEENKKFYQFYGVPKEKMFFVPYAVDNERFVKEATSNKKQATRKKHGIGGKNVVILFVGKLIKKKRPMDLLKAYEKLISNITLVFVGDGILRPELEKYVKEHNLKNVIFTGFKNQTELPQYYAMADIFVLPSGAGETWGLAVNEAMCFGLPIIVSDVVGCGSDLVRQEENGYIFPLGDIKKLAEYLKKITENDKIKKSFGKKSFEIIRNYSFKKDIEGILKALKLL